ncbi:DUF1365 domain-containing protein [Novosphingobium rosa]|uniref:DUF1365 domain-containing protein n=1 Tax=Novosphingobium rosa TaxID=76978 RepID=UPI00082D0694|nr:DUF1365 family protein [Novosphingobium rosa]
MISALYIGQVTHRRLRPRAHHLRYRIFSLLLDLDEIDAVAARLRLFSRNRFNLFSVRDRDYGAGTDEPLRRQIERHLHAAGIAADGGAIRLLTMPRILGFAFNPLNVYFCHAREGALRAILYEVNNTFGQRHGYLIPVAPGAGGTIDQDCAKAFHVSPFLGLEMHYTFRVSPPEERLSIAITASDDAAPVLTALHTAQRRTLSDRALFEVFLSHPLLTIKVVGGILWEAARLWAKGVPVHPLPPAPAEPVTIPPIPIQHSEAACI